MPSPAFVSKSLPSAIDRSRRAPDIHDELDSLLAGLRQDIAWLDRCLAEQAGGTDDEVRSLRMQMRIRCDGMEGQLARVAGYLERIVPHPPGDGSVRKP